MPLFFAWQLTALLSCAVAGVAMLYFFYQFPRTRAHPGPVLLSIFLSSCITNLARVALQTYHRLSDGDALEDGVAVVRLSDVANSELGADLTDLENYVSFFFWCEFFFRTAATMWFLMLALDLIFSLSNPFLPFNADNLKHHIFAWPAALAYCAAFRYMFQNNSGAPSKHVMFYYHLPAYLVLLYISGALAIAWRRSRRLEFQAHKTTRRMAVLILPYLAIFAVYTVVTFVLYLIQLPMERETPTSNAVDQLALVLECLGLFVLFCRDAGVFKALNDKSFVSAMPAGRTMSQANLRDSDATDKMDVDVSNNLRKDVMKYTSMGILESTKQSLLRPPLDEREFTVDDYNRVESMLVVIHGEIDSTCLSFRDCAPRVFQSLRQHFGIDPQFVLDSFDTSKILSEHGSEGKSGNIFYFTANKAFMVKSVPKEEYDTLRAILPQYHRYLLSNPDSMLCRYFGCYSISLPVGKRRMFFVVMQNLFNEGPVHQRFDLKGNCDRRQAIGSRDVEKHIQQAKHQEVIKILMMDIDFRKLSNGLALSPASAERLQEQLCDDIVFLASRGIIDYSLLIGVRHMTPTAEALPPLPHGDHSETGVSSDDKENVYYLGIIDMLQRHNWRWTVQRWVLGMLCKDTQDVSAVPPELYASRLEEFVRSRLFDIQGGPPSSGTNARGSLHKQRGGTGRGGPAGGGAMAASHQRVLKMEMDQFHPASFMPAVPLSPSYSIDSSLDRASSSSPSVAYSSVCQSPVSRASSRDPSASAYTASEAASSFTTKPGKKPAFFV